MLWTNNHGRYPILVHADDQLFPISNIHSGQKLLDLASSWAHSNEQEYHVGRNKTVALPLVGDWSQLTSGATSMNIAGNTLSVVSEHRYLGAIWATALNFTPHLEAHINAARGAKQSTIALARAEKLPEHVIGEMVGAKALGALMVSPFLFVFVPNAKERIRRSQLECARAPMMAPAHTSAIRILTELGWTDWWVETVRRSLFKLACLKYGVGAPRTVKVYSELMGSLQGRQLPQILQEAAGTLLMPTFDEFQQGAAPQWPLCLVYKGELKLAAERAWCKQWHEQTAQIVWPFPYASLTRPFCIVGHRLGELDAPWKLHGHDCARDWYH